MFPREITTSNVIRARERKTRNRALNKAEELKEAQKLGISVTELRSQKFRKVLEIIKNPPSIPSASYSSSYSRYNW